MSKIIGKKVGMTTVYDADGKAHACTVIEATPNTVTQIRTVEKDGYEAVQLGFGQQKEKNATRAEIGHSAKAGIGPAKKLVEFTPFKNGVALGDKIDVTAFNVGDVVNATGTSKGKGFQGVVKRYGFAGVGGQTHGQHNRLRHPGSIGSSSYPSRVFPGTRMAGRTGNDRVTVQNLKVLRIIAEHNLIVVNGSIPGAKNSTVTLTLSK
ncbi:MAG: 50S ribosomal protein L3 [Bacteroidota bacterium]